MPRPQNARLTSTPDASPAGEPQIDHPTDSLHEETTDGLGHAFVVVGDDRARGDGGTWPQAVCRSSRTAEMWVATFAKHVQDRMVDVAQNARQALTRQEIEQTVVRELRESHPTVFANLSHKDQVLPTFVVAGPFELL